MIKPYVCLFALTALLVPAYSQVPTSSSSGLTDYPVFRFFFKHVVLTEGYANLQLAESRDDSGQRHYFKNLASLTDAEEALLKSTATQADKSLVAFDQTTAQLAQAWRARYPAPTQLPASALAEAHARSAQRQQIVQGYVNALKAGMAPGRFQLLYLFVWSTEAPRIKFSGSGSPLGAPPSKLPLPKH
jgi:hypothetical protein